MGHGEVSHVRAISVVCCVYAKHRKKFLFAAFPPSFCALNENWSKEFVKLKIAYKNAFLTFFLRLQKKKKKKKTELLCCCGGSHFKKMKVKSKSWKSSRSQRPLEFTGIDFQAVVHASFETVVKVATWKSKIRNFPEIPQALAHTGSYRFFPLAPLIYSWLTKGRMRSRSAPKGPHGNIPLIGITIYRVSLRRGARFSSLNRKSWDEMIKCELLWTSW